MDTKHIIISGPSASGKSTLIRMLLDFYPNLSLSVSHTTREMRHGEIDGRDYFFVSKEEFETLIRDNQMLEYVSFNNNYYGTSYSELESNPKIFDIEYRGVSYFRERFPHFIYIFIDCDKENVRKRLVERGDSKEDVAERLRLYDKFMETKDIGIFHKIINNNKTKEEGFKELVEFLERNK